MTENTEFDPRRSDASRTLIVTHARTDHEGRRRKRIALVAGLVVSALLLSGGGVALAFGPQIFVSAPAHTSTSTPAPSDTRTPTPTSAAVEVHAQAEDPDDPATWVIGFDGIGPVKLGFPLAELAEETPTLSDETYDECRPSQVTLVSADELRLNAFGATDAEDRVGSLYLNARLPRDAQTLPRTEAGIGIGSTETELLTAYPGIRVTGTYSTSTYYAIQNESGTWVVFGIWNDQVDAIGVGPQNILPKEFCPA